MRNGIDQAGVRWDHSHLMFFQVRIQVAARAELQHSRKRVGIDFEDVHESYDVGVPQGLVDLVLSHSMPDIGGFAGSWPSHIQLMNLHRHFLQRVGVKGLMQQRPREQIGATQTSNHTSVVMRVFRHMNVGRDCSSKDS